MVAAATTAQHRTLQSSTHLVHTLPRKDHQLDSNMRSAPIRNRSKAVSWITIVLFAVPWTILIAERLIGTVQVTLQMQSFNDKVPSLSSFISVDNNNNNNNKRSVIPLGILTRTHEKAPACPVNQSAVMDRISLSQVSSFKRKIPKIIHQTSLRRCLMNEIHNVTETWRTFDDEWTYYFHDDEAVDALFAKEWPEFPHLQEAAQCILYGAVKADLWRYLVLWEYGGLYCDIDATPALFNKTTITDDDDGFFVVEHAD